MKSKTRWFIIILVLALAAGGGYIFLNQSELLAQAPANQTDVAAGAQAGAAAGDPGDAPTVTIQPAAMVLAGVSAAGNIELQDEQMVTADAAGLVEEIAVAVGQEVNVGDVLVTLDTAELERAVERAELAVETSANALTELMDEASDSDIAVARANITEAEENLADVLAGPSEDEIAAAQSSLASAWSGYNELLAGPSDAELVQLSADLKSAEVALAEAQRSYDQIAWRNDVGMTTEAADLQQASIVYESAMAAYDESTEPADNSDLQSALSSARSAQATLDDLLNSPTQAEIATAEAQLVDAEAALADLLEGASATEIRDAEIAVEQALLDLEEAYADLMAASITAPIEGTILEIGVERGERLSEGTLAVTMADTSRLELTIDVAEVDIVQVSEGQPVEIEIDALSGQVFSGVVDTIAPSSDADSSVVSYPVTIRLTDDDLSTVRPGMTAVATISDTAAATEDSWLVPTTAIRTVDGGSQVMVIRDETQQLVSVEPGTVQGEWTVVYAPDLQSGDQVIGAVTSYVSDEEEFNRPGGGVIGGGPPPGGGGGGGRPGGN